MSEHPPSPPAPEPTPGELRPELAPTAVEPTRAAAGGSVAPDRRPEPAPVRPADERDVAAREITTLQRRDDELRAEAHRHASHLSPLAVAASIAAAGVAAVARVATPNEHGHRSAEHDAPALVDPEANSPSLDDQRILEEHRDRALAQSDELLDDASDRSESGDGRDAVDVPSPFEAIAPDFDDDASDLAAAPIGGVDDGLAARAAERVAPGGIAEVGTAHPEATPWAGTVSIGTISSVDGDRAEQYTGRGTWTSFSIERDLHGLRPTIGESVQIGADGRLTATPEQQQALRMGEVDRGLGRELG